MEHIRNNCAREALKYIGDQTVIGLGGGSTVSCLIKHIATSGLQVKVVTPSFTTASLCLQSGLPLLPLWSVEHISVAFDGCDEVDEQLQALKSGGGIHTREKLVANMADRYILLVDESKLVQTLTFRHPVVLEVLEDALSYVQQAVSALGGSAVIRTSTAKDGYTVSDYGHPLLDVSFREVKDIPTLQRRLKGISGVIETSLFTEEVTGVLAAGAEGVRAIFKS
jgi:ribose 5-phosphate isomerase A